MLRDLSSHLVGRKTLYTTQGNRVHGSYYPLAKKQLEWQISISDVPKKAEKEQAKFLQARLSFSNQILVSINQ